MKILMSAFSCGPGCGSEPGIGWNWAVEAARQGHSVKVITQTEYQDRIETEIAGQQLPKTLTFDFFMPPWLERLRDAGCKAGFETATWQIVHLIWQFQLLKYVRQTYNSETFDIVHHITLGGIRHPTLLSRLGIPLVLGPLGGGERAPFALRRSLPWNTWLKELARDIHTSMLRYDPITRMACAGALVVYARTRQTAAALPGNCKNKTSLKLELGTLPVIAPARRLRASNAPFRLLYAGQLVFWKGTHLALRAVAEAHNAGHDVRLTIVGSGPDETEFRALAGRLGIGGIVTWRGQVSHSEIGKIYCDHDAFLFPSLHDSSGNVVLESLVRGLPVICLDLCGPAEMVTEACGRIADTQNCGEADCVTRLAAAIGELYESPSLSAKLSAGAIARSQEFLWPRVVSGLYADVESRLANAAPAAAATPRKSGANQPCPAS